MKYIRFIEEIQRQRRARKVKRNMQIIRGFLDEPQTRNPFRTYY